MYHLQDVWAITRRETRGGGVISCRERGPALAAVGGPFCFCQLQLNRKSGANWSNCAIDTTRTLGASNPDAFERTYRQDGVWHRCPLGEEWVQSGFKLGWSCMENMRSFLHNWYRAFHRAVGLITSTILVHFPTDLEVQFLFCFLRTSRGDPIRKAITRSDEVRVYPAQALRKNSLSTRLFPVWMCANCVKRSASVRGTNGQANGPYSRHSR